MTDTSFRSPLPEVVDDLEQQLLFSLRPVQPRTEFVSHLHNRLKSPPAMTVEREHKALSLLVVAFSLLTGALFIFSLRQWRIFRQETTSV